LSIPTPEVILCELSQVLGVAIERFHKIANALPFAKTGDQEKRVAANVHFSCSGKNLQRPSPVMR
jgi:hypothetical protein